LRLLAGHHGGERRKACADQAAKTGWQGPAGRHGDKRQNTSAKQGCANPAQQSQAHAGRQATA
jgi:hypothetical protein